MLIVARFLQFSGALVLLGSSLFHAYGFTAAAQPSLAPGSRAWLRQVLILSAMAAILGTVLWLVSSETRFGRFCLARVALLLVSLALSFLAHRTKAFWTLQTVVASLVVATFTWTGHGTMNSGWAGAIHQGSDLLHLWAAGAWFGALVPLAILILRAVHSRGLDEARAARHGLERFSAIGAAVVATLALSGIVNSWFLIGVANWRTAAGTDYGKVLLIKFALFALLLMLAAANRFWLTPRLQLELKTAASGRNSAALRALKTSIVLEIGLAALLLLAVGVLGTLTPPISGE